MAKSNTGGRSQSRETGATVAERLPEDDEKSERVSEFLDRAADTSSSVNSSIVDKVKEIRWERDRGPFLLALFGVFLITWIGLLLVIAVLFLPINGGQIGSGPGQVTFLAALGYTAYVGLKVRNHINDRIRAAEISEFPTEDTVPEALSLLDSDDLQAQGFACGALATVAEDSAGKVVKNGNREPEWIVDRAAELLTTPISEIRVRAAALFRSFSLEYPEHLMDHDGTIVSALTYPDSGVQGHMAYTAGTLGYNYPDERDTFIEPLVECLNDQDKNVRMAACRGLFRLAGPEVEDEVVPPLERVRENDSNPEVRQEADQALQAIRNKTDDESATGDETYIQPPPDVDFDDVAGMAELKSKLRTRVIEPFNADDLADRYGDLSTTGILFHGPPGTGKTHLAECLAGELGVNYASVAAGDIVTEYTGDASNIQQLFAEARSNQPALVFIDEIDSLAGDRSAIDQSEGKREVVTQLLDELSDLNEDDDVVIIGATNAVDEVDDAMLRPGRFDAKIEVPRPDGKARLEIFEHYMAEIDAPTEPIDEEEFVRETSGLTASAIEELVKRAARKAYERARDTGETEAITEVDVFESIKELSAEQGKAGRFIESPPNVDFDDVAGMAELKDELREKVIDPIENPELYEEYGIGVENGFLLYGPPGTGKTHVSRCLAGELDVSFINAKAGDLVSKWIGEGAENVQEMFAEARNNDPCLVFIDEIDALATSRGGRHQQQSERQMVNQFLEGLSTINDSDKKVVVIGATNRPEDVDDAMLRSGRLTEKIEVPPPDAEARLAIFRQHLQAPIDDLDEDRFADLTDGMVAADMENLADRVARRVMERAREKDADEPGVTTDDIEQATKQLRAHS